MLLSFCYKVTFREFNTKHKTKPNSKQEKKMKKLTMSLAVASILGSTVYASSIEDAFAKGKVSGELSVYTTSVNNSGSTPDTGYSLGAISLGYETASVDGFKASVGFMGSTKLNEKNSGNYGDSAPRSIMNIANVSYSSDKYTVVAGKQAIDLEWIEDYHEAVVGVVTAIPNTTIIVGHTERKTASANDGALIPFAQFNGTKGANVVDATYSINETTKVNGYYMDAPQLFSAIGGKVSTEVAGLGITGKYAQSSEDTVSTLYESNADGKIMALDLTYKVGEIGLNGGYIKTGKDNAIGSLSALGDKISPADTGSAAYGIDAKTMYVGASTSVAGFDLGALYAATNASIDSKELNLSVGKELAKNFKAKALYANINADDSSDKSYYFAQLVYSF